VEGQQDSRARPGTLPQVSSRAKLVIVFNHRFDRNIPVLDQIYAGRFDVSYLVPFYRGDHPRTTAVYESSHQFQGYFAQALERYRSPSATHYVFAADDMLLNPALDAGSLAETLGLGPDTGFTKHLADLTTAPFAWNHLRTSIALWHRNTGVEHAPELPSEQEASDLVGRHVPTSPRLSWDRLRDFGGRLRPLESSTRKTAAHLLRHPRQLRMPYPLLWGYSDFCVVPASALDRFAHFCGVFAAMGLFVEVAMPTALALACEEIRTEEDVDVRGVELWTPEEQAQLREQHHGNLQSLSDGFPSNWLYVHPVKLSRWDVGAAATSVPPAGA
jgi:hypothetical protein